MTYKIIQGDSIEKMKSMESNSIDHIICDPPYGTTKNKWDIVIPFKEMWEQIDRICKSGANIVFTASQPFTSSLILSNPKWFRYCDVYEKLTNASGQLNVNIMPLRKHEDIVIFRKPGKPVKDCVYNEEITLGHKPYSIKRNISSQDCYGSQSENESVNDGTRRAISIMRVENPRIKGGHPTQKPFELIKRLVSIYSNESDTVLDFAFGSGTTAFACKELNRNFIGIEIDVDMCNQLEDKLK